MLLTIFVFFQFVFNTPTLKRNIPNIFVPFNVSFDYRILVDEFFTRENRTNIMLYASREEETSWIFYDNLQAEIEVLVDHECRRFFVERDLSYMYIAGYDDGLLIYDISNAQKPRFLSQTRVLFGVARDCYDVNVKRIGTRTYAFMACERGIFEIIDVTDRSEPVTVGSNVLADININYYTVAIQDDGCCAYLVDAFNDNIKVFNITNVAAPEYMYAFSDLNVYGVMNYEDVLYVARNDDDGFGIYNISEPFSGVTTIYETDVTEGKQGVLDDQKTTYILAGSGGIFSYDVSNLNSPVLLEELKAYITAYGLFVEGDLMLVSLKNVGVGFFSITNRSASDLLFIYRDNIEESYAIYAIDNIGYSAGKSFGCSLFEFGSVSVFGTPDNETHCGTHTINITAVDSTGSISTSFDIVACGAPYCYGILYNDTEVCSGNGICDPYGKCNCIEFDKVFGKTCNLTTCDGIWSNDTDLVCSGGRGECIEPDLCECLPEYQIYVNGSVDPFCSISNCSGVLSNSEAECSTHGTCIGYQNCSCEPTHTGFDCEFPFCDDIPAYSSDVCHGHGLCYDVDTCLCFGGYDNSDELGSCNEWKCGVYLHTDVDNVCSGRGECLDYQFCQCEGGYEGSECHLFECGFDSKNPLACSGNGKCMAPNECDCDGGFGGTLCEKNLLYGSVMAPILSITGVSTIFLICVICCCCVCTTCVCIFIVGCLGSCMLGLGRIIKGQKSRMKKFDKLKNVDLLLKEQELEEDTSVAHLRINQELFKIDFEEIVIDKILGEGGSQSVVFKAFWKNRIVAFKCFKTRHVMENQDCYNEFEREVSILGSINHPHIISFYGASLKAPRVGIVMEFCEHGDLDVFLRDFAEKYGIRYPLKEKLRMLFEISTALDFLHGRSIIHRDIKLENVLVDSQLRCKLMDFGLSKVVDRMSKNKTRNIGTNIFIAPELVVGDGDYNEKVDVFSFGIMMWIAITENRDPYGKRKNFAEIKVANNPDFRPEIDDCKQILIKEGADSIGKAGYEWICKIIQTSWSHEVKERMSMSEISKMFEENLGREGSAESSLMSSSSVVEMSIRETIMRNSMKKVREAAAEKNKEGGLGTEIDLGSLDEDEELLDCIKFLDESEDLGGEEKYVKLKAFYQKLELKYNSVLSALRE